MAAEGLHGPPGQDLLAAGAEDGAAGAGGEAEPAAAAKSLRNRGDLQEGPPQQATLNGLTPDGCTCMLMFIYVPWV